MNTQPIKFSPDFRRTKLGQKCVMWFCAHCQREIKNRNQAVPVTIDWHNWTYLLGHGRKEEFPIQHAEIHDDYFGKTCFKHMEKFL